MTEPIPVLVTAVAGGSIGEQICKALRLGRNAYALTATNTSMHLTSVVQPDHSAVLPSAISETYIPEILTLVKQRGIEFIIPGSEPELIVLSSNREAFSGSGARLLINSESVVSSCLDKLSTNRMLKEKGFAVPDTFSVKQPADLTKQEARFPCVVKSARGSGSAAAFLAQTSGELQFFVQYLMESGAVPVVQEYIGDANNEFTVGVLHDPDGKLMGSVVIHRQILSGLSNRLRVPNRTSNSGAGEILALSSGITQGKIVDFPALRKQAESIAAAIGSTGPLNIQGRWDGKQFQPFEINPRFSGTTSVRAMIGFNEPEILINWHLHIPMEQRPQLQEMEFVRGLVEYPVKRGTS